MTRRWPQPAERNARRYRRAHEAWDREPVSRVERGGFGFRRGYRGVYAERRGFATPRGELPRREPRRSGWPHPIREIPAEAEARHLAAFRDRDLARSVDYALYNTIGGLADGIAVLASDAVVTLAGVLPDGAAAGAAVDTARAVPGVRMVRSRLVIRHGRGHRRRSGGARPSGRSGRAGPRVGRPA